ARTRQSEPNQERDYDTLRSHASSRLPDQSIVSARTSALAFGYFRSRSDSVSAMVRAISQLRTNLSSAGTRYHGAHFVLHCRTASLYALVYSFHRARSSRSPTRNFQFLVGSVSRSVNRFFCSSRDTCRKNLRITTSFSASIRSKSLI